MKLLPEAIAFSALLVFVALLVRMNIRKRNRERRVRRFSNWMDSMQPKSRKS